MQSHIKQHKKRQGGRIQQRCSNNDELTNHISINSCHTTQYATAKFTHFSILHNGNSNTTTTNSNNNSNASNN